jgi:hypothetical protein
LASVSYLVAKNVLFNDRGIGITVLGEFGFGELANLQFFHPVVAPFLRDVTGELSSSYSGKQVGGGFPYFA